MILSVARDGHVIWSGSLQQLHDAIKSGALLPTDYYWHEGMAKWLSLSTIIHPPDSHARSAQPTRSWLTCSICNALCPGLGYGYAGNIWIAIGVFILFSTTLIIFPAYALIVWIVGILDGPLAVRRFARHDSREELPFR